VSAYFDPGRIAQLQHVLGEQAESMVASMLTSLTAAIDRLEAMVAAGELAAAVQTAHAARNDALMLGADALQAALSELELAARDADQPRTRDTLARVQAVWPPTRDQLAGVARPR
jgi:HPt (histidine-containing phosphotransfer) domain-containing protein